MNNTIEKQSVDNIMRDAFRDHGVAATIKAAADLHLRLSKAGYVIVPVEPTEEMWSAGREPILDRDAKSPPSIVVERSWFNPEKDNPPREDGHVPKGDTAVWVYRAMLNSHGGCDGK